MGSKNPLGDGSFSNTDYGGRTTHTIVVEDYSTHTSSHNPTDAKTFGETTTRYDARGRVIATTQWLTVRGTVDEQDPPIAGLDSVSKSDGLTTQYLYDEDLTDNVGLDNSTGLSVDKLGGGGAFNVSLDDCITKLAAATSSGGAGISFGTNNVGSATVVINPEEELTVSIQDATGQTVITAIIESFNGSNPNDLITWNCSKTFDETIAGYGDVDSNWSIDALGNITKSRVDSGGRTIESVDADGNVSTVKYDASGRVKEFRDPNGVGFDATYDDLGQLLTRTDTYDDEVSYTYNDVGNQLTITDAKSQVTTHEYDVLGRRIKTTDRLSGETEYGYDANSNRTSITDAEDKLTEYLFDDANQKTKETYPGHNTMASAGDSDYGIIEFAFDPASRLKLRTDQRGNTCTFNMDLAGRLTSKDYRLRVNSPSGTIAETDTFTYDAASRMLTAESGRHSNTVTNTYDDAGRLDDESLTIGSGMSEKTYTVGREYGDRSQLWKLTYPDTTVVERTYNDRGQLYTVKYGATTIDTRSYDVGGRLSTSTYGNGVVTTYGYRNDSGDKDDQIDSIDIVKNATTIDAFDYAYDTNKNIVSESRTGTMSNYGWDTDDSGSSGYDDDDRLKYWERDDSNLTQEWSLSFVGDWNSITENTVATTHTHNDVHELTDVGSNSLSYDANGNMTTNYNGDDYSWDFDNRMTGADTDGTAGDDVTFEYDALGRRVRKDDGTNDIVYVHSGKQVIAEYDFGTAASSPTEQYAYGSYIDEPIIKDGTLSSGTGIVYYHHDRRFSVVALTNTLGAAVERYAYSAYGDMSVFNGSGTSISGTAYANATSFTGRQWDNESELYYFRARYFDATTGIFIGRDPLKYVDGLSMYRGYFVPNAVDPSGMFGVFFGGTDEGYPDRPPKKQPKDIYGDPARPGNIASMKSMYADDGGAVFYHVEYLSNLGARRDNRATKDIDETQPFEKGVVAQAHRATCSYVCSKMKPVDGCDFEFDDYVVDIFGWSRGAIGAYWLSEILNDEGCECPLPPPFDGVLPIKPVNVRFMGFLDAVNLLSKKRGMKNPAIIPGNVDYAYHEQRDGTADEDTDGFAFPRQNFNRNHANPWPLTHGQVGRNIEVRDHLIEIAKGKGVKFK